MERRSTSYFLVMLIFLLFCAKIRCTDQQSVRHARWIGRADFIMMEEEDSDYRLDTQWTGGWKTWAGEAMVTGPRTLETVQYDTDASVFFSLRSEKQEEPGYCVIDSEVNPNTLQQVARVFSMDNASCTITAARRHPLSHHGPTSATSSILGLEHREWEAKMEREEDRQYSESGVTATYTRESPVGHFVISVKNQPGYCCRWRANRCVPCPSFSSSQASSST